MTSNPPAYPQAKPRRAVLAKLAVTLVGAGVLAAAMLTPLVLGTGLVMRGAADKFLSVQCSIHEAALDQRSYLLASDGKTVLATLFTQNRAPVSLAQVPKPVIQALLATEDRRFYEHHGVDLRGLLRSAAHDVVGGGGDAQGGSTLTMQYVKQQQYYQARTDAEREAAINPTLNRKLEDAKCALDLEKHYTKDQILDDYLNIAFFGENAYGIGTAAQTYFGRSVSQLDVPQAALLVGLVQAPSAYDPFVNPTAALQRRNVVLQNMVQVGDLTEQQAAAYAATPIRLATTAPPPVPEGCAYANPAVLNAGFFCDYAVAWLLQHGYTLNTLRTAGLRIVTTLNANLQTSGQRAIWRAGLRPAADYILVMPSVDPRTGNVTTMITSRRYGVSGARSATMDPLFTTAYAGAGSTYKYFTAVAALTAGAPTSLRLSTPGDRYTTKHCASGDYTVHNAGVYPDTMPFSDALPQSSNTYFVAMEDEFFGCRLGPIVDTALRLGMDRLRQPLNASAAGPIASEVVRSQEPTFTLGQEPTSPLQLTGAFAAAVNDGVYCAPTPILRVYSSTGAVLPLARPACRRAMSPYVARTVVTMMRQDTHDGTAASYFRSWYARGLSDVAAKTGTDNNAADNANSALWFVGMTPQLVSAASLVNPEHPKQIIHGLPNLPGTDVGQDIFGAYASTYWLAAYGPELASQRWGWPSVDALGGTRVPSVVGQTRAAAAAALQGAGLRISVFPVPCGSSMPSGVVAYQEPPTAQPQSTVTVCISSGVPPYVYVPPPPVIYQPPPPRPTGPSRPPVKPPAPHKPPSGHSGPPKKPKTAP